MLERRVVTGSWASNYDVIFSVGNLFYVLRNPSMFVDSGNLFLCWWSVTNRFVDDLNRAR